MSPFNFPSLKFGIHTISLCCLFVVVTSCYSRVYGPNFQHNPQLENQGDWQISGSRGGVPELKSLEVAVAHAIYPNVGILLNAQYSYDDLFTPDQQGYFLESGLGIFNRDHRWFRYSIYALYGIGRQVNRSETIHYNRYALQPAVEFDLDGLYLTISARAGMISFDRAFTDYVLKNSYTTSFSTFTTYREFALFEPAITISYPWRSLLVGFQYIHQLPAYQHGVFARNYLGCSIGWRILR